jgi:hypothetical protein
MSTSVGATARGRLSGTEYTKTTRRIPPRWTSFTPGAPKGFLEDQGEPEFVATIKLGSRTKGVEYAHAVLKL